MIPSGYGNVPSGPVDGMEQEHGPDRLREEE